MFSFLAVGVGGVGRSRSLAVVGPSHPSGPTPNPSSNKENRRSNFRPSPEGGRRSVQPQTAASSSTSRRSDFRTIPTAAAAAASSNRRRPEAPGTIIKYLLRTLQSNLELNSNDSHSKSDSNPQEQHAANFKASTQRNADHSKSFNSNANATRTELKLK